MNQSKAYFDIDRRGHKRFPVRDGAFAVLRPQLNKLGQIVDISLGGLAFRYVFTGTHSNGSFEMDIFLAGNGFYLERVPIRTVSDFKMTKKIPMSSIPVRRCSVQFGELTPFQITQINHFLHNYTLT